MIATIVWYLRKEIFAWIYFPLYTTFKIRLKNSQEIFAFA